MILANIAWLKASCGLDYRDNGCLGKQKFPCGAVYITRLELQVIIILKQ